MESLKEVVIISSWSSYPKIYTLGHRAIKEIFNENVLIEEKIDGSQISFGIIDGELKIKSKNKELLIDFPEKMFIEAVEIIKNLDLHEGWTYRGEYLQRPKHNVLSYNRIPNKHIIIFDINTSEEEYLSYEDKKKEAERIGLEVVPKIYEGIVGDSSFLLGLLERESVLGGQKIEGVVIKNYKRFGQDKKILMGKYVSEKFKEVHNKVWKGNNLSSKDVIQKIIIKYKTDARWNKAVQHLKEKGKLMDSPKDIGMLVKEIQSDIYDECVDDIKDMLFKNAFPKIIRGIVAGFPEWYKERLLQNQFE